MGPEWVVNAGCWIIFLLYCFYPVCYNIQSQHLSKEEEVMHLRTGHKKSVKKGLVYQLLLLLLLWGCMKPADLKAAIVSTNHMKYSYSELVSDINSLQKKYPNYVHYNVIGKSTDKRNLYEVVLGNPDAKKHLLVIANLHAREYMTIQLSMAQIERYCQNYNKKINKKLVSKTLGSVAIHYIPSANPDGTAISQYGFGAIRNNKWKKALKNMSGGSYRWKSNARGVDLNRNWPIAWKHSGSRGSAGYRGPKAASEPEIKAMIRWVNRIQKRGKIVGVVSYHSTGSILYGRCAGQASSQVKKQTTRMYKLAESLTGYGLMPTESISYARGCSREYFLYKKNIPCITLEVGYGACPLGAGEFPSIWKKNKDLVIREAMLF